MMRGACRFLAGVTAGLLSCIAGVGIAAAARPAAYVVPANDPALAAMLLAAEGTRRPVLLFDPWDQEALRRYLAARDAAAECFHRGGAPAELAEYLRQTVGQPCTIVTDLPTLAASLWPTARNGVAVRAADYPWLLRAAAFAGATGAALVPLAGDDPRPDGLHFETLFLAGGAAAWRDALASAATELIGLADPDRFAEEWGRRVQPAAPPAVVIANASDRLGVFSPSGLSLLAPLVSAAHHAPLLLVSDGRPTTIEKEALAFMDRQGLRPTHVILVGDEIGLPSHVLPDPVLSAGGAEARGGGTELRVELFSGIEAEQPQDFAVGRVVGESAALASLTLARQLHRPARKQKPVIFLTNADEVFALGETISRATVAELHNLGLPVRAFYRREISPEVIARALKETELLVWEGHSRDLAIEESGTAATAAPDVVVLQGCYTLERSDPFLLMERGTQALVASSAAIYSAPGSAFAKALFDSLVYERVDLGTGVRNARNYLLALAQLQRARSHPDWRKTYRAALAFAFWGDPTIRPQLPDGRPAVAPPRWKADSTGIALDLPGAQLPEIAVQRYRARVTPRSMLGGLLLREGEAEDRALKALYFDVVAVPAGPTAACAPNDGWDVISLYAPRTGTLSILARPDWLRLGLRAPRGRFTFPLAAAPNGCPPGS